MTRMMTGKRGTMDLAAMEGGHWHQSQPDYCMARDADAKLIRNVAF